MAKIKKSFSTFCRKFQKNMCTIHKGINVHIYIINFCFYLLFADPSATLRMTAKLERVLFLFKFRRSFDCAQDDGER